MKRFGKRQHPDAQDSGLLQVMTISLFIILLAFFILLNSLAVSNKRKTAAAFKSLTSGFGLVNKGNSTIRSTDEEILLGFTPEYNGPVDFTDLSLEADTPSRQMRIIADSRGSALNISDSLLFDRYGTDLLPQSYPLLNQFIKLIKKNEFPVDIIGHTDNVPIYDEAGISNRELSAMRALAMLKYFINKGGLPAKRLNAFGWGPYRPAVSNKTIRSREFNRRMELVFVHAPVKEPYKGVFTYDGWSFNLLDE